MSKHKKPLKLTKKVEVPVNPIVFGCNALVEKHIDSTIGHSSETNPIVKSLLDGKTLHKKRRLKVLPSMNTFATPASTRATDASTASSPKGLRSSSSPSVRRPTNSA